MGALSKMKSGMAKSAKLLMLPSSMKGRVGSRWGEKMIMANTDIPISPAQMGMPDISKTQALPNNKMVSRYSFIFQVRYACSKVTA